MEDLKQRFSVEMGQEASFLRLYLASVVDEEGIIRA
jgi:hypothetical protein